MKDTINCAGDGGGDCSEMALVVEETAMEETAVEELSVERKLVEEMVVLLDGLCIQNTE